MSTNKRVLFVDDEQNILDSFTRGLRKRFDVTTANGAEAAIDILRDHPSFAVMVSDHKMPKMTGVELLTQARTLVPDTVRIMLTGHADVEASIAAVNEGAVFRFLTKPCDAQTLVRAIDAGIEQHRLLTAERELIRGTLSGAVNVMSEILSLTNPGAFGRAERIKPLLRKVGEKLSRKDVWKLELAGMLCQIGCVTLPDDVVRKKMSGTPLSAEEKSLYDMHPSVGFDLLGNIPRLGEVAEIVRFQEASLADFPKMPFGARLLKILLDIDSITHIGKSTAEAFSTLRMREGVYDQKLVTAVEALLHEAGPRKTEDVYLEELAIGMVLAENIVADSGAMLAVEGQEVSAATIARLRNFAKAFGLNEPFRVFSS